MCLSLLPVGALAGGENSTISAWDFSATLYREDGTEWAKGDTSVNGIKATTGNGVLTVSTTNDVSQTKTGARTLWVSSMPVDGYWQIATSTKGYNDIILSARQYSTSTGTASFKILYSLDNFTTAGTEIEDIHYGVGSGDTEPDVYLTTSEDNIYPVDTSNYSKDNNYPITYVNCTLPSEAADQPNVTIRFVAQSVSGSGGGNSRISTVAINGTPVSTSPSTVARPTAKPASGMELIKGDNVELSCVTQGAEIHYTTDGTEPTDSSTIYTSAIVLNVVGETTIKAIAYKDGAASDVLTATYTVAAAADVIAAPAPGAYQLDDLAGGVTLSCETPSAEIWYTTDGTDPSADGGTSIKYTEKVEITGLPATIKAVAVNGGDATGVFTFAYREKVETNAGKGPVVIYHVFGGGGNSGATYKNDFIVLKNVSSQDVDISGWSLQYCGKDTISAIANIFEFPNDSVVKAGKYFVIKGAAGSGGTEDLPQVDATWDQNLSGSAGQLALCTNTTPVPASAGDQSEVGNLADFIGFGAAKRWLGTAPTKALSNTTSALRTTVDFNAGYTPDNLSDYDTRTKADANCFDYLSALRVTATPDSGRVDKGATVTLGSTADDGSIYYTVSTDGSEPADPTAESTPYTEPITISADTVIVKAIVVSGGETSGVFTFTYDSMAPTTIAEARAAVPGGPNSGNQSTTTRVCTMGVVTFSDGRNVSIQDNSGKNGAPCGIGIDFGTNGAATSAGVTVGKVVTVSGAWGHYGNWVQIKDPTVVQVTDGTLPVPVELTVAEAKKPQYESVRVKLINVTLGAINTGGNTPITSPDGKSTLNIYKMPALGNDIYEGFRVDVVGVMGLFNDPQLRVHAKEDIQTASGFTPPTAVGTISAVPAAGARLAPGATVTFTCPTPGVVFTYNTVSADADTWSTGNTYMVKDTDVGALTLYIKATRSDLTESTASFTYTVGAVPIREVRLGQTGDSAQIAGVVTWVADDHKTITVQDETAAIQVFLKTANDTVRAGDMVKTSAGKLATSNYILQLQADSLTIESSGNDLPTPFAIGADTLSGKNMKFLESRRLTVPAVQYVGSVEDAGTFADVNGTEITVRGISRSAGLTLGTWYDVTGIVLPSVEKNVTDFGNGSSRTDYIYSFYLQSPDASWFTPVSMPQEPARRWNVVQFSGSKTLAAADNAKQVIADEGENKDGALATVALGNFLSQSGGHNTSSGWNDPAQNIQFQFSTKGFQDLTISVNMRASDAGHRDLKYQYSTDANDWTDLPGGGIWMVDSAMANMSPTFKNLALPAELENQDTVYLRVVATSTVKVTGGTITTGGAVTYAGLIISGEEIPDNDLVDASVEPGAVALGTEVALSNTADSTIQYRVITNSTPAPDYADYTGPITLSELPATIQAKAGNARVRSFAYTQAKVAPVTANYYSGKVAAGAVIRLSSATAGAAITYDLTTGAGTAGERTQSGLVYDAAAGIPATAGMFPIHISAHAVKSGWLQSDTLTLDYTEKAAGAEQLYFGQLHSHNAEYSDGAGTLAEALAYAKNSGTDFVAFTDHSNYLDDADHLGAIDDAHTGKVSPKDSSKTMWEVYNETIDAATTDDFIAIPGYEMTWSSGPGHINTFNSTGFVSRNNATLNNKTNDAGMQAYYGLLTDNPQTISQFNHPGTTFGTFADFAYYTPERDDVINMVEVGNGEGLVGSNGYFPSYQYYDMALSKGWHLAPTNNQDNHKGGWGNANTCRSVVLTDDFSKEGIFQAMRDRAIYATEDENLSILYTLNGYSMGSILPEAPDALDFKVVISDPDGEALGTISIITEGGLELEKVTDIKDSSYTWEVHLDSVDYAYYYIRVVEADKDIAVTAPVWATAVKKMGITSLASNADTAVKGEEMLLTTKLYNSEETSATVESVEYTLTRLGNTTSLLKLTGPELAGAGLATLPKNSNRSHQLKFTPDTVGLQTLTVTVVMNLGGDASYTFTQNLELEVLDPKEIGHIAIDAGHNNFYVSGDYESNDTNFALMAAGKGLQVTRLTEAITYDAIKDMDLLVLTVPYKGFGDGGGAYYSDAELDAIARYAGAGGSILLTSKSDRGDPTNDASGIASTISNAILSKLNAKMRVGQGIVVDLDPGVHAATGGQESFRLFFSNESCFNADSSFTAGILDGNIGDGYSAYNAAPILLNGATALVSGHSTTWATHFSDLDNDNPYQPKPNAEVVVPAGQVVVMGTEQLSGGGFLIVSGTTFFSNKEIDSTSGDDVQRYVNAVIAGNILEESKPAPEITSISHVQDTVTVQEGEKFTIQGIATSNASGFDQRTAFFDCIYVQDGTGGINVFPVDGNIQAGQTVQITGYVSSYLGERQLQARSVKVVDKTVSALPEPKALTTAQLAAGNDLGRLIQVSGVVTRVDMKEGMPETILVRDDSGDDCRVFIDGYITPDKAIANLAVGRSITATGMSSHDTLGPRMRVSDRANIICTADYPALPSGGSVAIIGQPDAGFCDWAGAGDCAFMIDGVSIGEPSVVLNQDGTAIVADKALVPVTGTLAYKSGFIGFWEGNASMQEGNFLAFRLTLPAGSFSPVITFGGKTVTVKDGSTDGRDYFDFIYRVDQDAAESFDVTIDLDGEGTAYAPTTYTFDLSNLVCQEKGGSDDPSGSTVSTVSKVIRPSAVIEGADSVKVTIPTSGATLNQAAEEKVISLNAEKPVILAGAGLSVIIPAGTLKPGDDVNAMLVNPKVKGNAIQITHTDGSTSILPMSMVGGGKAAYIAGQTGAYEIIDNTKVFPDVDEEHWAAEAIGFVTANELFNGMGDGSFGPAEPMTRSMVVTVLFRMAGHPGSRMAAAFSDVPESSWYAKAANWAAENGIMEGDGRSFTPDAPVTREQLCTVLVRYLDYAGLMLGETSAPGHFADADAISPWAADAVESALKAGLLTGKPGDLIDPHGEASRAEIATVLQRFVEGILK